MRALVLLILFAGSSMAAAQTAGLSCLPNFLSLQATEQIDTSQVQAFSQALDSENASGRFTTKALLDGKYDPQSHEMSFALHFDDSFNGVSLPYNFYAVLVIEDGQVIAWNDFTGQCAGPGIDFYPGAHIKLPAIKLQGKGVERLQIMVWGRL